MPIYEYVCEKCGAHLEVMQKMSDERLKRCRSCRGKLEKIISRTAFQLKGSGWYKTDYASKSQVKTKEKTEKSEKSDKTEKADKKAESSDSSKKSDSGSGASGSSD